MIDAPKKNELVVRDPDGHIVRKSNDEIGYRIKSGHLSLLSRKFLNVLIWYAQEMRDMEDEHGRWSLAVAKLIKDAKFASRDYELLRSALDELQEVRVIRPARGGGVTSEVMIPSYTLDNVAHEGNEALQRGQKRRGGELRLWFMLPPELKSQLLDPEQYTRLPIAIMATLKTVPGLALYEICRRYATNPRGVTNRDSWQNWWRVLTGATQDTEPPLYKYANRDAFKRGVDEVNRLTDIEVEVIEFKSGKFVRDLQFTVRMKDQRRLDMGPPPIDAGLLSQITELGFSISDAERLVARYSDADISATLQLVRDRMKHPNLAPIDSPAAYFRNALRDKYAASKAIVKKVVRPPPVAKLVPEETSPNPAGGRAMAAFEALPPSDHKRCLEQFAGSLTGPLASTFAKQGLASAVIRRSLAAWLVKAGY